MNGPRLVPARRRARWTGLAVRMWIPVGILLPAGAGLAASPAAIHEGTLRGDPPLLRPTSITLDPVRGELCVTDDGSRTLDVFDGQGLHRFRTDPSSGLRAPQSGALDSRGDFVCTDTDGAGGRTIRRLNFLGEPEPYAPEPPTDGWRPTWVLVAADGDYVSLTVDGLLARHAPGSGQLRWSRRVSDPEWERSDLLGRPTEAPDGTLYVPHAGRGVILRVGPDGEPRGEFGTPGTKRGELAFPVAVAIGRGGSVLVLDRLRHSVLVYDADETYRTEFGRVGYAPGDFYHPVALAASPDGRIWVAQGYEGRVQQFRLAEPP